MLHKVAIIHCPGHQKGTGPIESRNQRADQAAKKAAQGPVTLIIKTTPQSREGISEKQTLTGEEGLEYLTNVYRLTHLGEKKMIKLANRSPYYIPQLQKT